MGKRLRYLALFAVVATPAVAQTPPPAPVRQEVLTPSRVINVRLNPDLGKALPAVRAALAGLPVQVAEPADYELTTKRAFPQTLIAVDAREAEDDWDTNFDPPDGGPRPEPRTFELGNLVLGDFRGSLQELISRAVRARSLLAMQSAGDTGIESCLGWAGFGNSDQLQAPDCHPTDPPRDETDSDFGQFVAGVTNHSKAPRYVALLTVEPWLGVQRVDLAGGDSAKPLAPGASARSAIVDLLNARSERVYVVTISSDRPIDISAFVQPSFDAATAVACTEGTVDCFVPAAAGDASWSVSVTGHRVYRDTPAAMGGGLSVLAGMAPWMAEFYSTVPYTKGEIAADTKLPPAKSEFLAKRSEEEREHRCGASVIAANLVVTAAHCVAKGKYAGDGMAKVMDERRIRVGSLQLGKEGTTYAIAGVAVPSSYLPDRQDNDIALLLIKPDRDTEPMDVRAITVGRAPIGGDTTLAGLGWGYTGVVPAQANPLFNEARELQHNPEQLQFGMMDTLDQGKCKQTLGQKYSASMLCMVAPHSGRSSRADHNVFSCRGDSGGPLVRKFGQKRDELVGVTSWSMGCGFKGFPSVYTDVTKFSRWIAVARKQLKDGAAITVDDPAAPVRQTARRQ